MMKPVGFNYFFFSHLEGQLMFHDVMYIAGGS